MEMYGTGDSLPGHFGITLANIIQAMKREFDPYYGDWQRKISTGLSEKVPQALAQQTSDTSVCLSLDGIKVTPGIQKKKKGDINLLGKEEMGNTLEKNRMKNS